MNAPFSIRDNLVYVRVALLGRSEFDLEVGKVDANGVVVLPSNSWHINHIEQADQEMVSDEQLDELQEWLAEQGYAVDTAASDADLVIELRGGPVEPQDPEPIPPTDFGACDMDGLDIEDVAAGASDDVFPGFADPGGPSALRAATSRNPRNLPCPTCREPNRLTPADVARGYQCDACADRAERGF